MARDLDLDQLEPVEDGEDNTSKPILVFVHTLPEILIGANGVACLSLAFMSFFGRNPARYGGLSFYDSCVKDFEANTDSKLSYMNFASFLLVAIERFFNETTSTVGGSLVFYSLLVLFAGIILSVQLELNRHGVLNSVGRKGGLIAATFPLFAQVIGPATAFSFLLFWFWRAKRIHAGPRPARDAPMNEVDLRKNVLAIITCLSILGLVFGMRYAETSSGVVPDHLTLPLILLLLLVPVIPSLPQAFFLQQPSSQHSKPTRRIIGVATIATFLLVGAAGMSVHSHGFSKYDFLLKSKGGQAVADAIVQDSLSAAPARFMFVQFVHLMIASLMFCMTETKGTGGAGLIIFVTTLVGPAGAFGLIAAHHEFQKMKDDGLI